MSSKEGLTPHYTSKIQNVQVNRCRKCSAKNSNYIKQAVITDHLETKIKTVKCFGKLNRTGVNLRFVRLAIIIVPI